MGIGQLIELDLEILLFTMKVLTKKVTKKKITVSVKNSKEKFFF